MLLLQDARQSALHCEDFIKRSTQICCKLIEDEYMVKTNQIGQKRNFKLSSRSSVVWYCIIHVSFSLKPVFAEFWMSVGEDF